MLFKLYVSTEKKNANGILESKLPCGQVTQGSVKQARLTSDCAPWIFLLSSKWEYVVMTPVFFFFTFSLFIYFFFSWFLFPFPLLPCQTLPLGRFRFYVRMKTIIQLTDSFIDSHFSKSISPFHLCLMLMVIQQVLTGHISMLLIC